jgi:predicted esterase
MFDEEYIKVEKTARLTWRRQAAKQNDEVCIVLHGYAQLSTFFSRKLSSWEDMDFCLPEGLSKFYTEGTAGRVAASWMTKEMRLIEIEDNNEYMRKVIDLCENRYKKVHILGFSQGAATAARVYATDERLSSLTIWAGIFPPELPEPKEYSAGKPLVFVLGENDRYFNQENQNKAVDAYTKMGFNIIRFTGDHDILPEPLEKVMNMLNKDSLA